MEKLTALIGTNRKSDFRMDFSKVTRADVLAALNNDDQTDLIAIGVARLIPVFTRRASNGGCLTAANEVEYAVAEIVAKNLREAKLNIKVTRSIKEAANK